MEEELNDSNDLMSEAQEERKPNLNFVRVMSILFILVVYLVIFAKILFLK